MLENFEHFLISSQLTVNSEIFTKIKFVQNREIILSFTDIGKSCPSREF